MSTTAKILPYLDAQTRLLVRTILLLFGNFIKVENEIFAKNVPDPVIFVFNHNNYWENLLVGAYLMAHRPGKKLAFICDWMFGRLPVIRWFLRRIDPVYTYTKKARFTFLQQYQQKADGEHVCQACLAKLRHGQSLVIFPEGTRNKHPYLLKRGRKGVGEIVLRSGVPVLPVGIGFPQRKRNGRIPGFSPILLKFGHPLTFPEDTVAYLTVTQETRLSNSERRKLHLFLSAKVTHSLMLELARLCGKEYPFAPPQMSSRIRQYLENFSREGA